MKKINPYNIPNEKSMPNNYLNLESIERFIRT